MRHIADPDDPDLEVDIAPGSSLRGPDLHLELLEWESPNILDDVKRVWRGAAEEWLTAPTPLLRGKTPQELIGTKEEPAVRYLLRSVRGALMP
jgi:hypothetical protein